MLVAEAGQRQGKFVHQEKARGVWWRKLARQLNRHMGAGTVRARAAAVDVGVGTLIRARVPVRALAFPFSRQTEALENGERGATDTDINAIVLCLRLGAEPSGEDDAERPHEKNSLTVVHDRPPRYDENQSWPQAILVVAKSGPYAPPFAAY